MTIRKLEGAMFLCENYVADGSTPDVRVRKRGASPRKTRPPGVYRFKVVIAFKPTG